MDRELESDVAATSATDRTEGSEQALSDEELAELALAADPDARVPADAIPLEELLESDERPAGGDPLPRWYMPPLAAGGPLLQGWRRKTVFLIIATFILLAVYGLCVAYGVL